LRFVSQDEIYRIFVAGWLHQRHIESGLTVVALFDRRVVAGELKLVLPFELQRDMLELARESLRARILRRDRRSQTEQEGKREKRDAGTRLRSGGSLGHGPRF